MVLKARISWHILCCRLGFSFGVFVFDGRRIRGMNWRTELPSRYFLSILKSWLSFKYKLSNKLTKSIVLDRLDYYVIVLFATLNQSYFLLIFQFQIPSWRDLFSRGKFWEIWVLQKPHQLFLSLFFVAYSSKSWLDEWESKNFKFTRSTCPFWTE